ncbi:MAG TPA: hypothetical protein VIH99_04920 [Bdellovibrionota bacterium]
MQHRQQIREQLGIIEERLEDLGAFASANERQALRSPDPFSFGSDLLLQEALDSVRDLGQLIHEQQLFKSLPADDFLRRVCTLLVQDAAAQGSDVAISHFGSGKVSMEMAELVMGAIIASFKACLKGQKTFSRVQRVKQHLFPTASIYLELQATHGEVQFRLIDDGRGYAKESATMEKQFHKLREHIGNCGGWFRYSSCETYGGLIEFKVPLALSRAEALILREGDFELLLPSSCVAETIERQGKGRVPPGATVYRIDEHAGLVPGGEDSPVLLRLGVADLQFWVGCEAVAGKTLARRVSAADFVEKGSWMQDLGVFQSEGINRALPMLEGRALVQFYQAGEVR